MPPTSSFSDAPIEAVIFDLDGVLVSSIPAHFEAFRRTFAAVGREFRFDEYIEIGAGASREVLIRRVLGGDVPQAQFDLLMREKERHIREIVAGEGLTPIPGARAFVDAVRRRGRKTAVATASRTPGLLLDGAGLGGLFDVVVDRHQVERSKPAPDLYLRAASELAVDPRRSLVIEDAPAGVEAALAAGMRVIALTTSEPPDRLLAAHAVVGGFADIDLDRWLSPSRTP
jgi:HAD superfamily hydrolase (TIGR01509 family)